MKRRSIFVHFALGSRPLARRIAGHTFCSIVGHKHNGFFCNRCWLR